MLVQRDMMNFAARVIKEMKDAFARREAAEAFAAEFRKANPNFDPERF